MDPAASLAGPESLSQPGHRQVLQECAARVVTNQGLKGSLQGTVALRGISVHPKLSQQCCVQGWLSPPAVLAAAASGHQETRLQPWQLLVESCVCGWAVT